MSLRSKTFLFTVGGAILLVLVLVVSSRLILLESYKKLELDRAYLNIERARNALLGKTEELNSSLADWAVWDDTYEFMEDGNKKYIDSNLTDESFGTIGWSILIYVKSDGTVFYSKGYDFREDEVVPVADELLSLIKPASKLINHKKVDDSTSGMVNLNGKLLLIASRPIVTSMGEGPARGTLIAGRFILEEELADLRNKMKLSLEILDTNDSLLNQLDPKDLLEKNGLISIYQKDKNELYGLQLLLDVDGNPSFYILTKLPRDIYNQGLNTIYYFAGFLIVSGLTTTLLGLVFIEKIVLGRVQTLASGVKKIEDTMDFSLRVDVGGRDELATLTKGINRMLDSLQDFKQKTEGERNKMKLIISSMAEGLLVVDKEGRITLVNPIAQKLLEIEATDVLGKKWSELAITFKGKERVPFNERSFSMALQKSETIITTLENDHYYKTPSGKRFPVVSVTAPIVTRGQIIGAVKVFKDATHEKKERQVIEEEVKNRTMELLKEKAKLLASINSLPAGFIMTDTKGNVLLTNNFLTKLFGESSTSRTLDDVQKRLGESYDVVSNLKKCIQSARTLEAKDILWGKNFLHIFMIPVTFEEAKAEIIGVLILIEDETETKILDRSKDEFFSIASHELRTPLTAIRGNTSLIKQFYADKIPDQDFQEMINDIHESSVRLIEIVNDFLELSRLEQRKIVFKKESFDIVKLVKEVVEELKIEADKKGLSLSFEEKGIPYFVFADSTRVKQVFTNLVGNSIKYTDYGSITLSTKTGDGKKEVVIYISDTGRGIQAKNQPLLFRKFQQAGESLYTRDTTKGTGLGLYISKLMIEGMGGRIWLEKSEEGKGSVFAFSLQLQTNNQTS